MILDFRDFSSLRNSFPGRLFAYAFNARLWRMSSTHFTTTFFIIAFNLRDRL